MKKLDFCINILRGFRTTTHIYQLLSQPYDFGVYNYNARVVVGYNVF
jgi:hypothetical protein